MSRKGENIYKRKDGRWEGRYLKHIPGEKTRYGYVYASTYREARAKLLQAAAQWEAQPPKTQDEAWLLSSVAQRWEAHIAQQVKASTIAKYHTVVNKHLLPALGQIPVSDFRHELIEQHCAELMRSGGRGGAPLSARTVSDVLTVLRSILRFARRCGADVPCDGSSVRIRRPAVDIRVLSRCEQERLCRHICADLTPRNVGILLSLFTGLRVGEICALKWEDIAIDDRLLHVRRTIQRLPNLSPEGPRTRVVITDPKSATSARTIPLPEELVRVLSSLPGPHRGYFLTGCEEVCAEPRVMQYYFGRVIAACGIERANYHALRHTFATRCVELGFDVKSLSELLGHSTVSMTMDRYVHPTIEHKRASMQRLSTFVTAGLTANGQRNWKNYSNL